MYGILGYPGAILSVRLCNTGRKFMAVFVSLITKYLKRVRVRCLKGGFVVLVEYNAS